MPKTTAGRRPLAYDTLDQVMPDVDRLLNGYRTVGAWTLGQACNHLTRAVTGSVDGMSTKVPWLVRKVVGPVALKRVLKSGGIPEGVKGPAEMAPKPDLDDRAEAEALRAALRLFAGHAGPLSPHPFFGPLSREQWDRLHRIHCAHHLSFVVPVDWL